MIRSVAVVGSGLAGVRAAQALRSEGYEGKLYLIGAEPHTPYDRPSLSKEALSGELDSPPALVDATWIADAGVDMISGATVDSLDASSRRLSLSTGITIESDAVLLATGAHPRSLSAPGAGLQGIFALRTLDDCWRLKGEFRPGRTLVVVGGGLIGCEVAATARAAGLDVTIIEAGAELMQRVLDPVTAGWYRSAIERMGINVRLSAAVRAFSGQSRVDAVVCSDGQVIASDLVLVSIGAEPTTVLGAGAGLVCERGYVVDAAGRTSCPGIFSAGDAASWPVAGGGRRSFETYLNSQAQAAAVARSMIGKIELVPQTPVSWTKLGDHHLQMAGDMAGPGELVVRGDLTTDRFLAFRVHQYALRGCVAADAAKDFAMARRMVEGRARVVSSALADQGTSLRELMRASQGENA